MKVSAEHHSAILTPFSPISDELDAYFTDAFDYFSDDEDQSDWRKLVSYEDEAEEE